MSGDPVSRVPPTRRDPVRRHDPGQHHGRRHVREARVERAPSERRRPPALGETHGLAVAVSQVMDMLADRRRPLDTTMTREVIARLRYFAHDAPDPSSRAAVHVACAFLSTGDLDEARLALSSATRHLRAP